MSAQAPPFHSLKICFIQQHGFRDLRQFALYRAPASYATHVDECPVESIIDIGPLDQQNLLAAAVFCLFQASPCESQSLSPNDSSGLLYNGKLLSR